ncbi:Scr1 family TA system antitoxin-like transcriptional regulator [Kitasatospora purpeofusca]|uniref:Scr1 family TA system antitoxin-like transcriptional regulator n=1 Tax=Kitasatospora purpeofusca TaxID=67352 RepID=UPI0035D9A5DB
MTTHLPAAQRHPADLILGAHLRHLRDCQQEPLATVAGRLGTSPESLAAVEAGRSPMLRRAVRTGEGLSWARAYGAGSGAAHEWFESVDGHERHVAAGFAPEAYFDDGPAWSHRYQIVEREASGILLAAGGQVLPVPLQTEEIEEAVWRVTPGSRPRRRPGPALGALPGTGCGPCQVLRADLLTDSAALAAWRREVHRARREAFAQRIGRSGAPPTIVLLDEAVLRRHTGGTQAHARQMDHLVRLVETTALEVRVVAFDSGRTVPAERALLQIGGEALTVSLSSWDAVYENAPDPRLHDLLQISLDPGPSVDLLRQAARDALARP